MDRSEHNAPARKLYCIKKRMEGQSLLAYVGGLVIAMMPLACGSPLAPAEQTAEGYQCEAIWYNGPSENERCYKLQEQLSNAVITGDVQGVTNAIKNGANVNGGYYQSLPVLETAASAGKADVVIVLINAGARVNRVRPLGQSALKSAASYGHKGTVKALLENGADVCEKTEFTALQAATESRNSDVVEMLVRAGAQNCT